MLVEEKEKRAKQEVNYSISNSYMRCCGICKFYQNDDYNCTKVRGTITPAMWCKIFKPK